MHAGPEGGPPSEIAPPRSACERGRGSAVSCCVVQWQSLCLQGGVVCLVRGTGVAPVALARPRQRLRATPCTCACIAVAGWAMWCMCALIGRGWTKPRARGGGGVGAAHSYMHGGGETCGHRQWCPRPSSVVSAERLAMGLAGCSQAERATAGSCGAHGVTTVLQPARMWLPRGRASRVAVK